MPGKTNVELIVFFDGVCGLCNRYVDSMIRRDAKNRKLRFAPLQGETAAHHLGPLAAEDLDTIRVLDANTHQVYLRSEAIARCLIAVGGIWKILGTLLLLIPSPIRDWGYKLVAENRYKLFGKRDTCRLPTKEEREYLLP